MTKEQFEKYKKFVMRKIMNFDMGKTIPKGLSPSDEIDYRRVEKYYKNLAQVFYYIVTEINNNSVKINELIAANESLEKSKAMIIELLKGDFTLSDIEDYEAYERLANGEQRSISDVVELSGTGILGIDEKMKN